MKNDEDVVVIGDLPGADSPADAVTISESGESDLPKTATFNDDGSVTLRLAYPVALKWRKTGAGVISEDAYDELVFYRLTGKDMMTMQAAARGELGMISIALSCKMPVHKFRHIYERMDGADIAAASQVVSSFLTSGPPTGR